MLTQKIQAEVAALARDLDPDEFSVRLTDQKELPIALTVGHRVNFSVSVTPAKGPLPPHVSELHSMDILRETLDQRLEQARQETGGLLDKWIEEEAGEYRKLLPPERCQKQRPVLGVQQVCSGCEGGRQVTCTGCGGRGRTTCTDCGGRGKVTCVSCGGSGMKMCGSCGGAGGWQEAYNEYRWDPQTNTGAYVFAGYRRVPCSSCGESGRHRCSCFDGTQTCTGCSGGGLVTCSPCGGSGVTPCHTCGATGMVHHTGCIECSVRRSTRVEITSDNPEDEQTFRERVPFDQIGRMTSESSPVQLYQPERNGHELTLLYRGAVPVECAEASFGGERVRIRAYGRQREIYNYHNLVERILEADLASLEKSLQEDSLFRIGSRVSLAGITKRFLASEMNALIAEAPAELVGQETADQSARRAPIGKVIRNALLLTPARRLFRRSGIVIKIILALVALQLIFSRQVLFAYLIVAGAGAFYERRHLRRVPPESWKEKTNDNPKQSHSAEVAKALSQQIAVGLLSLRYLERASKAVGKAVPRLYGPLVLPMGLWGTLGATALLVVGGLPVLPGTPVQKLAVIVALTVVAWVVVERRAQSQLRDMLSSKLYERVKGQFKKTRGLYRLVPVAGFVCAWYAASFLLTLLAAAMAYLQRGSA